MYQTSGQEFRCSFPRCLRCLKQGVLCAVLLASPAGAAPARASVRGEPAAPITLRSLYGASAPRHISRAHTALLLIDFQSEFFEGRLPLPGARPALAQARALARWARAAGILVVHVQQRAARPDSPVFAPGSPGAEPRRELRREPEDWVIEKTMGGAFSHTELERRLRERGLETLIVAGLMTHLAVQISAADAAMLGYQVIVAADATATRALPAGGGAVLDASVVQAVTLAALGDRVADVLDTASILALPVNR